MRAHLGEEIADAKGPTESPLFIRGQDRTVSFDGTTQDLFLKGRWQDLLPHFKYALSIKGINFSFKFTTDEKLRSIFVGNEAYAKRAKSSRDEEDTFNSLGDFVKEPQLLIIRLGFLGYKNIAMPGLLHEALLHREEVRKPTWIVEVPSSRFGPGHHAYDPVVADYILARFKPIEFESTAEDTMSVEDLDQAVPTEVIPKEPSYKKAEPAWDEGVSAPKWKKPKQTFSKKKKKLGSDGGGMGDDFST
jgi:hypothetical protein